MKKPSVPESDISDAEKQGLKRMGDFFSKGSGYSVEHGTRPATIGFVLSSSPIALLAWYVTVPSALPRSFASTLNSPQGRRKVHPLDRHDALPPGNPLRHHTILAYRILPTKHLSLPRSTKSYVPSSVLQH